MTSYNKQHRIDTLERAIARKKAAIKDTKQLCNAPVTAKWIVEQKRQLRIIYKRLRIVKNNVEPVFFTNDMKCEFTLLRGV